MKIAGEVFMIVLSAGLSAAGGYASYKLVLLALGRARR